MTKAQQEDFLDRIEELRSNSYVKDREIRDDWRLLMRLLRDIVESTTLSQP